MKLITACSHVDVDREEQRKRWGNKGDDGTFTIITELCEDCFTDILAQKATPDMPIGFAEGINHEETTFQKVMDDEL